MVLSVLVSLWVAQAGCSKDTDCKGERICEAGRCVAPAVTAAPPPPPPPPAPSPAPATAPPPPRRAPLGVDAASPAPVEEDYPRVVRRAGEVCVQSRGDDGQVKEDCRADQPVRAQRSRRAPEPPPEPAARFVADVLFQGGVQALVAGGDSAALPQGSAQLSLGARFRSGVGVVGLVNVNLGFIPGFTSVIATFAPGIRFGDRSHFTLAAGPGLFSYASRAGSGAGAVGSVVAQGVFAIAGPFALALSSSVHFDVSGVMFNLGAGFGFGAL